MEKYNFQEYSNKNDPVVFFGMYEVADYLAAIRHKGHLTILWRGNDARQIPVCVKLIPRVVRARNIANSEFTSESLWKRGIPNIILPITPTLNVKNPHPRGGAIYFYTSMAKNAMYGGYYVETLRKMIPYKIITAHCQSYARDELQDIYKSCFIGLRLTSHDGLPNTVCELGLMGRRCVYNGSVPNAISYSSLDDVISLIHLEYENRLEDNSDIVDAMYDFLDIGDSWLYI